MGLEMELEFEKYCRVDLSPKADLPHCHSSSHIEKRSTKGKPTSRRDIWSIEEDFSEISFRHYRSASCKSVTSKEELKRGSVYKTSETVRKLKKMGSAEGRKKIESSRGSDPSFSFKVIDNLCYSDEENRLGFLDSPMNLNTPKAVERDPLEGRNFRYDRVVSPRTEGHDMMDVNKVLTLHKSSSAKVEMPQSPSQSESDFPKTRFSPIRKMFDPFMKSKSLRSPGEAMRRNKTFRKSLLRDFSSAGQEKLTTDDHECSISPAHLQGRLKLETKHGVPFFEFSLRCPEEVFVANTWKSGNDYNWVYTFHSILSRKKSNTSGWLSNNGNKESSMVGQMQVSCYLCSELQDQGDFSNSTITEFVSYDVSRARNMVPTHESCNGSDPARLKLQQNGDFDSNHYPWARADLHPNLEIATIVIQVPFDKRESLKCKKGDKIGDRTCPSLLDPKERSGRMSPAKVKVVTPSGNHGLPTTESRGPSPLLDRWRLSGGCDCGGWDMACPLIVYGSEDRSVAQNQWPLKLFLQGAKEHTPALTITFIEEGQYAVDFHARLSTLQAFSICVAIFHCTENSASVGEERNRQLLQCSSLKVFIEEEMKFLIEAVTDEKKKVTKTNEEIPPSFVLNPPFSPIGRV